MKTFRKLLKKYFEEIGTFFVVAVIAIPIILVVLALMFAPGMAIAYFSGNGEIETMLSAGSISFAVIGLIGFAIVGIRKVVKDYQRLKREDSEE